MSDSPGSTSIRRRPAVAARLVLVLVAAALVAGCGKKGNPVPPADEPVTYPQAYPKT